MRSVDKAYYDHLISIEGWYSVVYLDSGGEPTVGIGHLLTRSERASGKIRIDGIPVAYRHGLTEAQILALSRQDTLDAAATVNRLVKVSLNQNQFNALVSFTFNIGNQGFADSTLLRLLNQGLYQEVPKQMRRWKYDNGEEIPGLINRREKEIKLWLTAP